MLHGQFFVDATGDPDIRVKMFQKVHEISPNTLLFVNDYSILMWQVNEYVSPNIVQTIKFVNLNII